MIRKVLTKFNSNRCALFFYCQFIKEVILVHIDFAINLFLITLNQNSGGVLKAKKRVQDKVNI